MHWGRGLGDPSPRPPPRTWGRLNAPFPGGGRTAPPDPLRLAGLARLKSRPRRLCACGLDYASLIRSHYSSSSTRLMVCWGRALEREASRLRLEPLVGPHNWLKKQLKPAGHWLSPESLTEPQIVKTPKSVLICPYMDIYKNRRTFI